MDSKTETDATSSASTEKRLDRESNTARISPPTSAQLVSLLEFEIQRLDEAERRPGWTTWALGGSLAAVVWKLAELGTIQDTVRADYAAAYFLLASLLLDATSSIHSFLSQGRISKPRGLRFLRTDTFWGSKRPWLLASLARYLITLLVCIGIGGLISRSTYWLIVASYGILSILFLINMVLSVLPTHIGMHAGENLPKTARAVVTVITLLPVAATLAWLAAPTGVLMPLQGPEVQIGLLTLAAIVITTLLTRGGSYTPLLEQLVGIRRDLGLGKSDTLAASREVEIALAGLQLSDVLQQDLDRLMERLSEIGHENDSLSELTVQIDHLVDSGKKENTELIVAGISRVSSKNKHIQELYKKFKTEHKAFALRARFLGVVDANRAAPEFAALLPPLDQHLDVLHTKLGKSDEELHRLLAKLDKNVEEVASASDEDTQS